MTFRFICYPKVRSCLTDKVTYTKLFLKELNKSYNDINVKEYMPLWWQNTRTKGNGGLRLTEEGFELENDKNSDFVGAYRGNYNSYYSTRVKTLTGI